MRGRQEGSLRYDRFLDSDRFFIFVLRGFAANRRQQLDLRTREAGIRSQDTGIRKRENLFFFEFRALRHCGLA